MADLIKHLDGVKKSVQNDADPKRWPRYAGYFALPRLIFCYVDYLGLLYVGKLSKSRRLPRKGTSWEAVKFIKKFLGRFDKRYRENAGLLYDMFRNGTVHLYQPKVLHLKKGKINYLIGHPRLMRWRKEKYRHLEYRNSYLAISTTALFKHLVRAIEAFAKYASQNPRCLRQGNKILRAIERGFDLTDLNEYAKKSELVLRLST